MKLDCDLMEVTETRRYRFKDKVFVLADTRRLANALAEIRNGISGPDAHSLPRLRFLVECEDDSKFESQDPTIFSDESLIVLKKVQKISMYLSSYDLVGITIYISHSRGHVFDWNSIEIRGSDATWVGGNLKKIEEIIVSTTPQNNFIRNYEFYIKVVFSLSIGIVIMQAFSYLPLEPSTDPQPQWISIIRANIVYLYIVRIVFWYSSGYFPADALIDKLKSLWPSVEIQIGPEHKLTEKNRRFWIANALILGVLPLLINVIYDFGKYSVH